MSIGEGIRRWNGGFTIWHTWCHLSVRPDGKWTLSGPACGTCELYPHLAFHTL